MKLIQKLTPFLIALAILLSACSPGGAPMLLNSPTPVPSATPLPSATPAPETPTPAVTSTPAALEVSDGLNGTLTFAQPPQRIIGLAPSAAEILFAVGAGQQVVAREDFTNYPPEAAKLPSVGGSSGPVSAEQVVSYKPDLVIVTPLSSDAQIKALKDLKIPVLMIPNPKTLAEMYADLKLVGQITGHSDEAQKLVVQLQAREQKVADVVAKATTKPKVFYEIDGTDPAKPWTTGPGTFIDMLIRLAGGENVGASLSSDYAQISQEDLLVKSPDYIILGDANFGMTVDKVKARPGWNSLQSVKKGNVLPFNDDLASRPGPRLLDGLEALVKAIHPELADQLK